MNSDVIGSRYRLGAVVTSTPETTTWDAHDAWLDERVLIVRPEPGCGKRFAALAGALLDRSSAHLVDLYDIGATTRDFVVFRMPPAMLSDEAAPFEEEDVLVAGRSLGDALEALHERGAVHGDLHPGSVVVAESGEAELSPWPLAPRPQNWNGPGGFGSDPDEPRDASARDDVRALGAVLLGALAGPPVFSSGQVENLQRELAGRAPNAVTIADRALTSPAHGGYAVAAELRDDCAAALAGRPIASDAAAIAVAARSGAQEAARSGKTGDKAERSEGRRAAAVLAASGAAVFAGFGVATSVGTPSHAPSGPVAVPASGCVARADLPRCAVPDPVAAATQTPSRASAAPARLADKAVRVSSAPASGVTAVVSTVTRSTAAATATAPPSSTTTTAPAAATAHAAPAAPTASSTTTSSSTPSPSTTTTTAAPTTTTTTTSVPPTTTTSDPPTTTTSTSTPVVQAGLPGGHGPSDGRGH